MNARYASCFVCALAACAAPSPDTDIDLGLTVAQLRPDTPGTSLPPPVFGVNDQVEEFDSRGGSFRIHYARAGEHAVPIADADRDGVPDFVRQVADEYDAVGTFYADKLGFERPVPDTDVEDDNGGDSRFDVYLLDFSTSADGSFRQETCIAGAPFRCTGYMLHENDFVGRNYPSLARANRILASHEYFHAVQSAYNAQAGGLLGEGTAVWASEQYDPTLNDLEQFVAGYLQRTDRALTQGPTGPVDPFAYGSSLFFQFLSERFEPEVIRELWTALRASGEATDAQSWPPALDFILRGSHRSSLEDAFAEFTRWNLYTAARADPSQAYARGSGYPEPKSETVSLPFEDENLRVFQLSARFYTARAGDAGSVSFVASGSGDLSGLRLILAREVRGRIEELRESPADTTRVELDVESGDAVHAVLLNTRSTGESLRPDICLGSDCGDDDVDDEVDAGERSSDDAERRDDSGCSALAPRGAPRGSTTLGWFGLVLTVVAACTRQRRRSIP